ncbi:MAG: hypothetical protein PHX54_05405 [Lentimicrobiaceae bacterium]|nr:hypothetical protein [Lentimicrobiaceae bacterium]
MQKTAKDIKVIRNLKILEVTEHYLLASRGYTVMKKSLPEGKWKKVAAIPEFTRRILAHSRLVARLLRLEIYFMKTLSDGTLLGIARKGLFRLRPGQNKFEKCFNISRGTRPMNFAEDEFGNIYFGEYFHNAERDKVHIYCSNDRGNSWRVAYTFEAGAIRHIHGIHYDSFTKRMWVTTGDLQNECIIGYSDDGFNSFTEVYRGGQEFRSCKLLFTENEIFYGTDSELEQNHLRVFNRESLQIINLTNVQGSVINATTGGELLFFNTTVEPSAVNTDRHSYIWCVNPRTRQAEVVQKFEKDKLDHRYFQFGQCYFPENKAEHNQTLYFSGCALKSIDGHSIEMSLNHNFNKE